MRPAAFLDTSAWFSALSKQDAANARTSPVYRTLIREGRACITSNLVVTELHALILRRLGRDPALAFLDSVYAENVHEVRFVDRELELAATDRWIRPFRDKRFSLADAVSFEIMRQENIRTAFALDRHFAAAGFQLLPA